MAFYTGQAVSFSELLSALKTAVELNGWLTSGNIIYKNDCFVKVTAFADELRIKGGTGASANELTGDASANAFCRIRACGTAITFPVNYDIHVHSNSVFLIINFNIDFYQHLAFGIANKATLIGTGNWYSGSVGNYNSPTVSIFEYSGGEQNYGTASAPFWNTGTFLYGRFRTAYIHLPIDNVDWCGDADSSAPVFTNTLSPLYARQPSIWNSEAILLPALISVERASNKVSIIAEINDCRLLRITNYEPGQIVQIGHDKWKIYPFYRKNIQQPSGGISIQHSGTLGWAIRYDGP